MTTTDSIESSNEEEKEYDYAYLPFNSALDVALAIVDKLGGKVKNFKTLEEATGVRGGGLRGRVFNAKKYGLIEGRGEMRPTELSMRIIKPKNEEEGYLAMRESILNIPLFKELYQRYKANIPENEEFFKNALEREYSIPTNISSRVLNAIKKNFELLKSLNLPTEGELILEKVSKVAEEFETPKKTLKKSGNFLVITFGEHVHEIPIKTPTDWKIAKSILSGLEEGWTESKKENHDQGESAEET